MVSGRLFHSRRHSRGSCYTAAAAAASGGGGGGGPQVRQAIHRPTHRLVALKCISIFDKARGARGSAALPR